MLSEDFDTSCGFILIYAKREVREFFSHIKSPFVVPCRKELHPDFSFTLSVRVFTLIEFELKLFTAFCKMEESLASILGATHRMKDSS